MEILPNGTVEPAKRNWLDEVVRKKYSFLDERHQIELQEQWKTGVGRVGKRTTYVSNHRFLDLVGARKVPSISERAWLTEYIDLHFINFYGTNNLDEVFKPAPKPALKPRKRAAKPDEDGPVGITWMTPADNTEPAAMPAAQ